MKRKIKIAKLNTYGDKGVVDVDLPGDAEVLSASYMVGGFEWGNGPGLYVAFICSPDVLPRARRFAIVGNGDDVGDMLLGRFVGTAFSNGRWPSAAMRHVFDMGWVEP